MILPRPCPSSSWLLRTFIIFWRWKNDQFQRNFRSKLKILDSKIFLSNLESEGRRGIIMGVTRLLLLEPFYYIALYWGYRLMNNTADHWCNFSESDGSRLHTSPFCIRGRVCKCAFFSQIYVLSDEEASKWMWVLLNNFLE